MLASKAGGYNPRACLKKPHVLARDAAVSGVKVYHVAPSDRGTILPGRWRKLEAGATAPPAADSRTQFPGELFVDLRARVAGASDRPDWCRRPRSGGRSRRCLLVDLFAPARPAVIQLRKAAHVYGQSFAAFFLPSPPGVFRPPSRCQSTPVRPSVRAGERYLTA